MKKIYLTVLLFLAFGCLNCANAMNIGTIDYGVLYAKIPQSAQLQKQIEQKFSDIRAYAMATKKIMDSNKPDAEKVKLSKPRMAELEKMKKQYSELRKKQEDLVIAKTKAACDAVVKTKKVDIIFNKNDVVSGGIDVTNDVLKAVK